MTFETSSGKLTQFGPFKCRAAQFKGHNIVKLTQFGPFKLDILFSKLTLDYDDGTNEDIPLGDYDYFEDNGGRIVTKYVRSHTFPGPGIYKINLRYFNRPSNLQNIANSVNTPLYTETQIAVDPYLGCNSTPQLENMS